MEFRKHLLNALDRELARTEALINGSYRPKPKRKPYTGPERRKPFKQKGS